MSKQDGKEESKFGFKDRDKAEETLRLLEDHDMAYRKLTVRGLLGRAKRVLGLTKAEEKINNIKAAMEVFENWLSQNGTSDASKKSSKKNESHSASVKDDKSEKADTVQGLGFKDKDRAIESLKVLEGRDPDYQKLAVKGLVGRAKRTLPSTRDDTKVSNISEAIEVFEKFLDDFETKNKIKDQRNYLPISIVQSFASFAEKYDVNDKLVTDFLAAYKKVGGDYKHLRTLNPPNSDTSWDIVRNKELQKLTEKLEAEDLDLFEMNKDPSKIHIQMIMWAYSPNATRIKALATKLTEEQSKGEKKGTKRKTDESGSDDDEPPKKK